MANGFGSLYVGSSGLRGAQNAMNVVANNLSNVDTKGYVREQVIFADRNYNRFGTANISDMYSGLGVEIGDVIHTRDMYLDRSYRTEAGRYEFYQATFEAADEIDTLLREGQGTGFSEAIGDLYDAFNEFAKTPELAEVQNVLAQKCELFISRAQAVYDGMKNYQSVINQEIKDKVDKINELSKKIGKLNDGIQSVESAHVETAMEMRDARDQALDELAELCNITYQENIDGIVKVQIEGQVLVDIDKVYQISMQRNKVTGYITPYWQHLSDPAKGTVYEAFNLKNIRSEAEMDVGRVKGLLLARGESPANYTDITGLTSEQYDQGISNSVMRNTEAELDYMIHEMVTSINNYFSPLTEFEMPELLQDTYTVQESGVEVEKQNGLDTYRLMADDHILGTSSNGTQTQNINYYNCIVRKDAQGKEYIEAREGGTGAAVTITDVKKVVDPNTKQSYYEGTIAGGSTTGPITLGGVSITEEAYIIGYDTEGKQWKLEQHKTQVCDTENACVGRDGELPPRELFERRSKSRYAEVHYYDLAGNEYITYAYNEEDPEDTATLYSLTELQLQQDIRELPSLVPFKHQNGDIGFDMAEGAYAVWKKDGYHLNPSDETPVSFANFYSKLCSDLWNNSSVMKTTAESLDVTKRSVEEQRQAVLGVNADEELQSMIKFQNAYNASSRYINVVNEMIQTLLYNLGAS